MSWCVLKLTSSSQPQDPWYPSRQEGDQHDPHRYYRRDDPVGVGLVESLARPGGNITGLTDIAAVSAGKRLELLKETIPKLHALPCMRNPKSPGAEHHGKKANWRREN